MMMLLADAISYLIDTKLAHAAAPSLKAAQNVMHAELEVQQAVRDLRDGEES
jgi:hypothetical protein